MANELQNKVFHDEAKAREWLENHLWPAGPVCAHCGVVDEATPIKTRKGWYQCNACRKQFSVTVGTLFERSHIPLNKWLLVAFLMCASKKGISAHQVHRMIGVSYKSTWFMMHRLREAMREGDLSPIGGQGKHVEVDETFIGSKRKRRTRIDPETGKKKIERGYAHKHVVMALVERGGRARAVHVDDLRRDSVYGFVLNNVHRESRIQTDEATHYRLMKNHFKGGHGTVRHHIDEYVKGDDHTNTIEGYFSIFKRGMKGVYQHCGEQHLHRYLAEFDFRYNERAALDVDDKQRTEKMLKGIVGKRLTYRRTDGRADKRA